MKENTKLYTMKELLILGFFSCIIGVLVALVEVIFGKGIHYILGIREQWGAILFLGLPLAGLCIVSIFEHWGKISKKGMNLVFEVEQGISDWIPLRLVPFMIGSTWLTHLFGGSVGREGVAVQIGATISHYVGKHVKIPDAGTIFLVAGIAAGFSGLFSTPIAAVFFAIEVLVAGTLKYRALGPCLIASFVASTVSSQFGIVRDAFLIDFNFSFDWQMGWRLIGLGLIFGVIGGLFAWTLFHIKHYIHHKIENPYLRIFILGSILALLLFLCGNGRYSNTGENLIVSAMHGQSIYWFDWLLKFGFTIFTLSIGFQGGDVTPLFSIGACLGVIIGPLFGLPPVFCAALGYVAVFGAGTNTLLAPIAIGMEIFGYQYFPFFFVVCVIAFLVNRNESIYALQRRAK